MEHGCQDTQSETWNAEKVTLSVHGGVLYPIHMTLETVNVRVIFYGGALAGDHGVYE
jgi:hypothetical protein